MEKYLLGIDVGTSACKVTVFDERGQVKANETMAYAVYYPKEGWAEQDPKEWWEAVCRAIKSVLAKGNISPGDIGAVGVDGQSWSSVFLDRDGEVLVNTPIWMDTRAKEICEKLRQHTDEDSVFALCGNPLEPCYTTPKILWYQEHYPELSGRTFKVLQSNSYIVFKLTGIMSQDLSQGYGLHCFDMHKGKWDEEMCRELGIEKGMLPDIYPCHEIVGKVNSAASSQCGLLEGTLVAAGGLDAACASLGAGVLDPGQTQEQGGQAGGMSICTDTYRSDRRLILSFHVVPDMWLLQGGTTGGGGVMRWLEQEFGAYERGQELKTGESSLDQFNRLAEKVAPGSDGMVFLPYMAGERSPIWDPEAKGGYYGINFGKSKGHFIRSAMEGVAFSLRHNLDVAKESGAMVKEMYAVGGSANSLVWTQIKSDVTGKRILVPASDTAATLGAAILAGVGAGMYRDFHEGVKKTVKVLRTHEPDASTFPVYEKNYQMYRNLYARLKTL
ncbi:MAG: FGGY-family carbohydrate kinase [Hungatella sp.]|nr:FGGY-family carbohydrate kinase [Hungatella sp.]